MDQKLLNTFAEEQLKSYGQFLESHDEQIAQIQNNETLPYSNAIPTNAMSNIVEIDINNDNEELILPNFQEYSRPLTKVLLTFGNLCIEINELVKISQELQQKFMLLDENVERLFSVNDNTIEHTILKMSETIDFFCQVQFYMQHAIVVVNNLLLQCGSFLGNTTMEINLFSIFDAIAEMLEQMLVFNEILANSNFRQNWTLYKRTISMLVSNTSTVPLKDYTLAELNGLHNALQEIEFLFSDNIIRNFLDSLFPLKAQIVPKAITKLIEYSNSYIAQELSELEKFNACDFNDFDESKQLVRLNIFCLVLHELCGQIDAKHVKCLLELNAKHPDIMLYANIVWSPTQFLLKHTKSLIKADHKMARSAIQMQQQGNTYAQQRIPQLQRDSHQFCRQISAWILQLHNVFADDTFELKVEQFKRLVSLLLSGQRYAHHIDYAIKQMINRYTALRAPLTHATIVALCKLIELWQLLQHTFHTHATALCTITNCLLQYLQYKVLHLLAAARKKIAMLTTTTTAKSKSTSASEQHTHKVGILAALKFAEKCFKGPPTRKRFLLAMLALDASVFTHNTLSAEQQKLLKSILARMKRLQTFLQQLQLLTDDNLVHVHRTMYEAFLKYFIEQRSDLFAIEFFITDANDFNKLLHSLRPVSVASVQQQDMGAQSVRAEVLAKLCAEMEIYLRLEALSVLLIERNKPFECITSDFRSYVNARPIEMNGHFLILKDALENYFSATFYNLTTISMQDWRTYERMRHLAIKRLLLVPVDDCLPNQIIDQGIDVLQIMRNIHIFVSKYVYNMNLQVFVEKQSNNKHLDTIGIRHVANSVRTHGTGVINTTVNFIYQFLRQKFYTFSTFLYDEQIKSRLVKELRSFSERKLREEPPTLYPYERAETFNKDIRKLGLSKDGETYMDLFRRVITQVGNAMGYIRLVRSGSKNANYCSSIYLPKFESEFVWSTTDELHEVTQNAAKSFECSIENILWNFSDRTDYFQLLSKAFQPFFSNPHNQHLKNFFLIVPPLILNYVENMLAYKSKINKKSRQEAVLFDDGFAVGLSYILKLLQQNGQFNELHWHSTVSEQLNAERRKIKEMLAKISADAGSKTVGAEKEKLMQTLALTERRINTHEIEHNLLHYNLRSAEIIFQ